MKLIREGKTTCVILAGGSGSRLGYEHPKGMYDINLPSHKSIFQILTERFLAVQMLAHNQTTLDTKKFKCKLLIMTSGGNHEETYSFFEQNNFFKADPEHLVFFKQASLPAIDTNGKIVMRAKDEIN